MRSTLLPAWIIGLVGLLTLSGTAAAAPRDAIELSDADYANFVGRTSATQFAAHGIPFVSSKKYLLFGTASANGFCVDADFLPAGPKDVSAETEFGVIDLARDDSSCEKVVEAGPYPAIFWTTVVNARAAFMIGLVNSQETQIVVPQPSPVNGVVPLDKSFETHTEIPLEPAIDMSAGASAANTKAVGVYTEYNDGANPVFDGTGKSIPVNYADSNLTYDPLVCDKGGTITGSVWFFAQTPTGWRIDTSYNNHITIGAQCTYTCTATSCLTKDYDFQLKFFIQYVNPGVEGFLLHPTPLHPLQPGFPTCFGAEHVTYNPNGVRSTGTTGASNITYTQVDGPSFACVSWQRKFTKLYVGPVYPNHRTTYSKNPS